MTAIRFESIKDDGISAEGWTVITDYMLTYGGPELFVLVVILVVTPFLYRRLLKQRRPAFRITAVALIWLVALAIAYTDVFVIAKEAKRLCTQEAGLRVYTKVAPDGIYGLSNIKQWHKLGVPYVEHSSPAKLRHFREELIGGSPVETEVSILASPYERIYEATVLEASFTRDAYKLVDRRSRVVLGEIIGFKVFPGWLDSHLLGVLGFSWTPPRCDGHGRPRVGGKAYYSKDLVQAVFK